jgi:hypothetical protein
MVLLCGDGRAPAEQPVVQTGPRLGRADVDGVPAPRLRAEQEPGDVDGALRPPAERKVEPRERLRQARVPALVDAAGGPVAARAQQPDVHHRQTVDVGAEPRRLVRRELTRPPAERVAVVAVAHALPRVQLVHGVGVVQVRVPARAHVRRAEVAEATAGE